MTTAHSVFTTPTLRTVFTPTPSTDSLGARLASGIPEKKVRREKKISLCAGTADTEGVVRFSWKDPYDAPSYFVEWAPFGPGDEVKWTRVGYTENRRAELQGLIPGNEYWFRVIAVR